MTSETSTGDEVIGSVAVIENTHGLAAHVHAVETVNINGVDYTNEYDANGNMTRGWDITDPGDVAERLIAYNAENMPVSITVIKGGTSTVTEFLYDGEGKRARKSTAGGSTTYYYGEHFEVKNGVDVKYIFAGNLRVAMIRGTDVYYFHKDHLKSSSGMTDVYGMKVESTEYMPFGMTRAHTGTTVSDYKFTDQEWDGESGLYNYDARLYDPVVGVFVTADSIVPRPFDPQSLKRYAYCRNNPLIYVDPTGHHYGAESPGGKADFGGETVSGKSIDTSSYSEGAGYKEAGDFGPFGITELKYKEVFEFKWNRGSKWQNVKVKTTIFEENGKVRETSRSISFTQDKDTYDYSHTFGTEGKNNRLMETERALSEGEKDALLGLSTGPFEIVVGIFTIEPSVVGIGVTTCVDAAVVGFVEFGLDRGIGNYPGINGATWDAFGSAYESVSEQALRK